MKLKLTNSLSKKKELFKPQKEKSVSLYVCGITPYDYSHLGHGRCYVSFDILVRLLKFLDYDVTYVRNYTDIDDKLLKKASESDLTYTQIAQQFIDAYKKDMSALNNLEPTIEPRVTTHIPEIIDFIKKLVDTQKAYVLEHDVYFDITSFDKYGKLSHKNIDDLESGARVQTDTRKKHPGDFALWKGNDQKLFWESPWGYGRPGWHIECSVMAKKHLGETIDIHAGGADLIFPHHENEIAQSESLHNKTFAQYWLHNAFVNINKEKMSKSLGNIVSLKDIFKKIDPMVLRYYFLQHHYRTPIDFNIGDLDGVKTAYKKLITNFGQTKQITHQVTHKELALGHELTTKILNALCDDLNTSQALGLIFQSLQEIKQSEILTHAIQAILQNILGLTLQPLEEEIAPITPEIEQLIKEREAARAKKDWAQADVLRDKLLQLGYHVHDKKTK